MRTMLVHESRVHVAVAAADLHLRARAEHEEAVAVGVRLDLLDLIEVDDGRAVDALEVPGVEPLFEVLHRLAQDQAVVGGIDAHIVAGGVDALDAVDVDAKNLSARSEARRVGKEGVRTYRSRWSRSHQKKKKPSEKHKP